VKPTTALLIVLGFILGPAYFAYCEYLSGTNAETHVLTERARRWTLDDGTILRLRSGMGYKPLTIALDPELNRYRLRLTFEMAPRESATIEKNKYQVSVLEGDLGLFERSFEIDGTGSVRVTLDPMEALYVGNFVLLLEEIGTPPLPVSKVTLQVRNRVEKPLMWMAWSGVVMFAFGLGIVIRDLISGKLKR
jgi:hypothetical protein